MAWALDGVWNALFTPVVAVVTSPDANEIFKCDGLASFEEFLAPLGTLQTPLVVHDVQGTATTLESFHIRFRDPSGLRPAEASTLVELAADTLRRSPRPWAGKRAPWSGAREVPSSRSASEDGPTREPTIGPDLDGSGPGTALPAGFDPGDTPWFDAFAEEAASRIGSVEQETFNHPVACFMVVSTLDKDPVSTLVQLFNTGASAIPGHDKGFVDPSFLRYYVLLQDRQRTTDEEADMIFQTIRKSFGLQTVLLRVNSVAALSGAPGGTVEAVPSTFWPSAGVNRPENGDVQRVWETFVSKDDLDGARAFVADFVTQHLVPFMEKTVANLNEQVASARRGLTGRLFTAGRRYFGVGASSRSPTTSPSLSEDGFMTYAYSTPEAQMRRLADFAFMLRDWKLALSVYDTVRKDFQVEEKAIKYYAATLEMCGLCALLLESQPASAIRTTQFDACVDKYKETKSKPLWLRAALAYLAVMRSKGWWKESAAICLKMTAIEDSDLLSALWLEQAALSFQRNVPPLTRKYAFHMVLAGHRYYKCGERDFAALCYYLASTVLHSSRWSLAEDHINFTLGRQSYHLGDLQHAMTYFVRLVRASKQPPSQQAIFLKEFLHVCEQTALAGGGRLGPIDLGVPEFVGGSAKLTSLKLEHANGTDAPTGDDVWANLEELLVDGGLGRRGTAPLRSIGGKRSGLDVIGAVGEPLYLCTDARNPLGVPITLTDVSVRCQFAGSIEKDIPREQEAATDSGFELNVIDSIEFAPGETKTLNLGIVPRREGRVVVHGVSYKFFGVVPAAFSFSPDGTPTRTKVSSRTSALQADVMQPMPLLQAVFQDVPDRLVSGEARRASLELFNKGSLGMGNVLVGISHPGFFWFGEDGPSDDPMAFGRAEAESAGPAAGHAAINNSLETMVVVSLSDILKREGKHPTLAPGQSVRITTWVRGDRIGKHAFRLLFGYQSEAAAEEYRTLRHSLSIAVLPSLRINAFTRPSAKHLSEFVLGLEIENLKDSPLNLNNLVAVSPSWRMLPFGEASSLPSTTLSPAEVCLVYFKLTRDPEASRTPRAPAEKLPLLLSRHQFGVHEVGSGRDVFFLPARQQWRMQSLAVRHPENTPVELRSQYPLILLDDVDFVLSWTYPALPTSGTHFVMGINLGLPEEPVMRKSSDDKPTSAPRSKVDNPVRVLFEAPESVRHDFSVKPICVVPITVHLENISTETPASVTVEFSQGDLDWDGASDGAGLSDVFWVGTTTARCMIAAGGSKVLSFHAAVMAHGVYNVGRYSMTVEIDFSVHRQASASSCQILVT